MQPPAGIDMSAIRDALLRRQQGGGAGGAGSPPIAQQVSSPPSGQTPLSLPPQVAPTGPLALPQPQPGPQQGPPQPAQQAPGGGGGQGFDGDTKAISKALIARLLKVL